MPVCEYIEKAYRMSDGELSQSEAAAVSAHAAACPECAGALACSKQIKSYFAEAAAQQAPARLQARVLAELRKAADEDIMVLLRAMVPAGALAFAALGCWLMIDYDQPVSLTDLIVESDAPIAEVVGQPEDPVKVFKLEPQEI